MIPKSSNDFSFKIKRKEDENAGDFLVFNGIIFEIYFADLAKLIFRHCVG
jgi:hypothetical protein